MEMVINAVYEKGIFKPLAKVDFAEHTLLKLTVSPIKKSIADQMRGLYSVKDDQLIDEIIAQEDWL